MNSPLGRMGFLLGLGHKVDYDVCRVLVLLPEAGLVALVPISSTQQQSDASSHSMARMLRHHHFCLDCCDVPEAKDFRQTIPKPSQGTCFGLIVRLSTCSLYAQEFEPTEDKDDSAQKLKVHCLTSHACATHVRVIMHCNLCSTTGSSEALA